uniref:Telomeric repeat binding factor a n=1 Tax=Pygocentrus nattereri TaxID=42514 RepID=A0AAR2LWV3_PYGNA
MAAAVQQPGCEELINRWIFDFYSSRAVDAFRSADYGSFAQFRDLLEALVVRPIDGRSDMKIKLRLMQFLSQINDGDKPDVRFQNHLTPLESALKTFEDICTETEVLQNDLEHLKSEMFLVVIVCIKNEQFQKAGDMLHKYFPKGTDSAGKKKLFEDLIKRRYSRHTVIKSTSYSEFKQDMLDFIEKLYPLPEPFLLKVRLFGSYTIFWILYYIFSAVETHSAETTQLSLNRLRTVYLELAKIFSVSAPFSQLEEEVQKEAEEESGIDLELNELDLRLSETQDEENGSVAGERASQEQSSRADHGIDQPEGQEKERPGDHTVTGSIMETSGSGSILAPYQVREVNSATPESTNVHPLENSKRREDAAVSAITVAQLVIEEDSQSSDMEANDSQQTPSPLKIGSSEDNPLQSLPMNSTPVRKKQSDWVRQGVARYGEGRWEKIKNMFPFKGRTAVNIKDRWRTMKKQKFT